jgi:hypothetical protein
MEFPTIVITTDNLLIGTLFGPIFECVLRVVFVDCSASSYGQGITREKLDNSLMKIGRVEM